MLTYVNNNNKTRKLLALLEKYPDNYYYEKLDDNVEDIICYKKIALPESMVPDVIKTQGNFTTEILSSSDERSNRQVWEDIAIDLIGPWKVTVNNKPCEFSALTCIDTTSNLVELVRIDHKTAEHIRDKFAQTWLCRYPRPIRCVHDKGGEFIGREFQWLE
jgi:hypothetical protein